MKIGRAFGRGFFLLAVPPMTPMPMRGLDEGANRLRRRQSRKQLAQGWAGWTISSTASELALSKGASERGRLFLFSRQRDREKRNVYATIDESDVHELVTA
jgi:hypothetical protein